MKKVIITICGAVALGSIFAFFYFKNTKDNIVDAFYVENEALAFQVGVYRSYENALKDSKNYPSGTIVNDGEFYRVYIAIANQEVGLNLQKYYDEKGIKYYVKKIVIPNNFLNDFNNYQKVLLSTNDYDAINKKVLEEYNSSLYGT